MPGSVVVPEQEGTSMSECISMPESVSLTDDNLANVPLIIDNINIDDIFIDIIHTPTKVI